MSSSNPNYDFYSRVRNAILENKKTVEIPYSKNKNEMALILKKEGFVKDVKVVNKTLVEKRIIISLKYNDEGKSVINKITGKSKPSKRIFLKKFEIPKVKNGYGICVLSTNKGILTGKEARVANVGGELLFEAY
tara:strand:+ start:747 stop:1148 length:402 start_codon:yes stop_codon:yes gene_type:complete